MRRFVPRRKRSTRREEKRKRISSGEFAEDRLLASIKFLSITSRSIRLVLLVQFSSPQSLSLSLYALIFPSALDHGKLITKINVERTICAFFFSFDLTFSSFSLFLSLIYLTRYLYLSIYLFDSNSS